MRNECKLVTVVLEGDQVQLRVPRLEECSLGFHGSLPCRLARGPQVLLIEYLPGWTMGLLENWR